MTVVEPAGIRVPPGPEAPLGYPTGHERPPDGEEKSIARLLESLVAMFPAVPEPHVRDCVKHICAAFANAPIRTYIPILVARQARAALINRSSTAEGARVGER
jgi:hypothetical protein